MYITAVLSDRTLHKLARNATDQRVALGMELDLDYSKVGQIRQQYSDATDQAFHVLMVCTRRNRPGMSILLMVLAHETQRWYMTVLYHLNSSLYFVGDY